MEALHQQTLRRIITGFPGAELNDPGVMGVIAAAEEGRIGGVILFGFNAERQEQLERLCKTLHEKAFFQPFFICIDQEGGAVERLGPAFNVPHLPSAKKLSASTPEQIHEQAYKQGLALNQIGININFSPCIDLDRGSAPISGKERAYAADAETVISCAEAYIAGLQEAHVCAVLKHYPGHGSARGDTHEQMIDITEYWSEEEELPFTELLSKKCCPLLMTAHLLHRKIDEEYPASLSYNWIDKLRNSNVGDYCLISDDFHMSAIQSKWTTQTILSRSLCGGVDLLLFSNNPHAARGLDFVAEQDFPHQIAARTIELLKSFPAESSSFLVDSLRRLNSIISVILPKK